MSPENQWLEDVFPIEIVPFLGDELVSFRECKIARCIFILAISPFLGDMCFFRWCKRNAPANSAGGS